MLRMLAAAVACALAVSIAEPTLNGRTRTQSRTAAPYYPERWDWQKRRPEEAGFNPARAPAGDRLLGREREPEHEGPRPRHHRLVQPRALQHPDRPGEAPRRPERSRHPTRLHRRGVGRHDAGRHDVQRHEVVPVHRRRPRAAAGTDKGRDGPRAAVRAHDRPLRIRAQRARSPGSICCARRATGRGRCGASRTGPTGRKANGPPTIRTGR